MARPRPEPILEAAIFDRYNIIHEQKLLDASERA